MPEPLPQRQPMPWLPPLRELVRHDPAWAYRDDDGAWGTARLRVWLAGEGYFAVVTERGGGRSVTNAARAIRRDLAREYGEPFGLAEHWPADQSPETGEHVDLVLPPGWPDSRGWTPLWPLGRRAPHYEVHEAWWAAHGPRITEIPA